MILRPSTLGGLGTLALLSGAIAAIPPAPATPRTSVVVERPTPITTVAGAFARWPHLTSDEGPVRIEGVVTGTMPSGAFRMHDGELGIYVTKSPTGQTLTAGERVFVTGVLRKGGFSPWITPSEVTQTGHADFPEAKPATYQLLASGTADNQWVEIEGVIRAVQVPAQSGLVVLDLGMIGGNLRVLVISESPDEFEGLIDAEVMLRGVAAVNVNAQKHVVEPSFRVPSVSQISVRRAGQRDPFVQPLVPLQGLMRFSLGVSHQHRVRTSGVVTRQLSETMFFLHDGPSSVKVETVTPQRWRAGEMVEVAGFPVIAEGMAVLQQAISRSVGLAPAPQAKEPSLASLLDGTHNSELVRIQARLVDWVSAGQSATLVFQAGDQFFKGLFNLPASAALALPEKNSLVNVTGICVINELEDSWVYRPRSFVLLLADLNDLHVLQAPPWWTPERLRFALIGTGVVLLAAVGWVWALRRQVGRKRQLIEQQARHAAALEERSRIARELHDTLEQGLTGLSLQMKAMETDLNGMTHPVRSRLHFARQMLRQSRALARNAIRELRADTLPSRREGLCEGIKRVADSWNHSGALEVKVQIVGEPRRLSPPLEPHLLGIGTEAMTNAVKHGRASTISVEIAFHPHEVAVRIRDDGVGFDSTHELEGTSGCFGLLGMRERAREIHGDLSIRSEPGKGTDVCVTVPTSVGPTPVRTQTEEAVRRDSLPAHMPAV